MKKLLSLLIVAALLTACSGGSNEPTGTEESTVFRVGMECAYAPFNYQVSEATETSVEINGGYCDGYDVMIAQRIADSLGMELEVQRISWNGLVVALQEGEIDAIIAGMTATDEREESVDFTTPYYDSHGMIMIVRANSDAASFTDIQQFSGLRVVGQVNTNYDDVIDQIEGVIHETPRQTYPEMVVALQAGDVDGITAETAVANGIVAANPDLAIVTFAEGHGFEADTTVSIGLAEGTRDSEFFNNVQSALDAISEEERAELMAYATNNQPAVEE